MEPLFFGPKTSQLYGVYHEAASHRAGNPGVVLFYPVGQEYMRIHRAYVRLANRLAAAGFHVLRFDYRGQGNSAGTFAEATLDGWAEDGRIAIDELSDIAGVERIAVVGVRVGALVASQQFSHPLVRYASLWEPRFGADGFLSEMRAQQDPTMDSSGSGTLHVNGFAVTPSLQQSLAAVDITHARWQDISAVQILSSMPGFDFTPIEKVAACAGLKPECHIVDGPTDWNTVDSIGGAFLPHQLLADITRWLDETCR